MNKIKCNDNEKYIIISDESDKNTAQKYYINNICTDQEWEEFCKEMDLKKDEN